MELVSKLRQRAREAALQARRATERARAEGAAKREQVRRAELQRKEALQRLAMQPDLSPLLASTAIITRDFSAT